METIPGQGGGRWVRLVKKPESQAIGFVLEKETPGGRGSTILTRSGKNDETVIGFVLEKASRTESMLRKSFGNKLVGVSVFVLNGRLWGRVAPSRWR
jgi:hypothetical protein